MPPKRPKLQVDPTVGDDPTECLARALQPIVRALQERVIGVGEWIEAVKIASYRAAHQSTDAETGRAVFSRMSIRTGLSRAELTQVRTRMKLGPEGRRPGGRNRLVRVIEAWLADAKYLDASGTARSLAAEGPEPNLTSLAREYAGDVPPVSVIAELHRYGLIEDQGSGFYKPITLYRQLALSGAQAFEQFMTTYEADEYFSALRVQPNLRDSAGARYSLKSEGY